MTIFYNVEGRKYSTLMPATTNSTDRLTRDVAVSPELIPRFFLTMFESGVSKMSLGLNGATESSDHGRSELESVVHTINGTWRYELENGWVVEQSGPMQITLMAEPVPGDPHQFRLRIEDLTFTAPNTSHFFRSEKLDGNRIHGHGPREVGPMTPRISPGLAARKTGEPGGGPGMGPGGILDDHSGHMEQEDVLRYENVTLPPLPFQAYGFPAAVWRFLAVSRD